MNESLEKIMKEIYKLQEINRTNISKGQTGNIMRLEYIIRENVLKDFFDKKTEEKLEYYNRLSPEKDKYTKYFIRIYIYSLETTDPVFITFFRNEDFRDTADKEKHELYASKVGLYIFLTLNSVEEKKKYFEDLETQLIIAKQEIEIEGNKKNKEKKEVKKKIIEDCIKDIVDHVKTMKNNPNLKQILKKMGYIPENVLPPKSSSSKNIFPSEKKGEKYLFSSIFKSNKKSVQMVNNIYSKMNLGTLISTYTNKNSVTQTKILEYVEALPKNDPKKKFFIEIGYLTSNSSNNKIPNHFLSSAASSTPKKNLYEIPALGKMRFFGDEQKDNDEHSAFIKFLDRNQGSTNKGKKRMETN